MLLKDNNVNQLVKFQNLSQNVLLGSNSISNSPILLTSPLQFNMKLNLILKFLRF